MKIITIANRKGGVGKTATAQAIGAGLTLRGYRVLYIDLDSQTNLTFDLGLTSAPLSSMEVLTGTATAREAITNTPGGELIPGSPTLAGADLVIEGTGKEYRLREALEPLQLDYDYCIIDTPPALGVLTINALTASDSVIIPVQAEVHSVQGIGLLYEAIRAVQKYTNPGLKVEGVLLTRYNGRAILSKDMRENLEKIAQDLDTKVFQTPIRECISIKEAQALQSDIFRYAPRSNASKDYEALIEDILFNEE